MNTKAIPAYKALGRCAWCRARIPNDAPVCALGGRKRPEVDLSDCEGKAIRIQLVTRNHSVIALIPAADSDARKEGNDFMFLLCSEECASALKCTMEREIDLGSLLFGKIKKM